MKLLTQILVGAVALAAAGTVAAQAARAPAAAEAFKPFYFGGSIGISNYDLDAGDFPPGSSVNFVAAPGVPVSDSRDEQATGWQAFGGWRFNRFLAVEGGYTSLGKAKVQYRAAGSVADISFEDEAWTLAGMATMPFDYGLSIFGQLGVAWHFTKTHASGSVTGVPISDGATDNRAGFLWGVGAGWDFHPNFGVRMQYQNFGTAGSSTNTGSSGTSMFSGSAIVRF